MVWAKTRSPPFVITTYMCGRKIFDSKTTGNYVFFKETCAHNLSLWFFIICFFCSAFKEFKQSTCRRKNNWQNFQSSCRAALYVIIPFLFCRKCNKRMYSKLGSFLLSVACRLPVYTFRKIRIRKYKKQIHLRQGLKGIIIKGNFTFSIWINCQACFIILPRMKENIYNNQK